MTEHADRHARHVSPPVCPTDEPPTTMTSSTSSPTTKKIPKQSLDYAIRSLTAGGIAACAAKTVVAPLDRVKILFQASNPQFAKYTGSWTGAVRAIADIWHNDGGRGLFRGHSATLLRIFPYGGIKFMAYEQVRAWMIPSKEYETHWRRLASGSLAGSVSVFVTYPLEVIRVRLAWSRERITVRQICRQIYTEQAPVPTAQSAEKVAQDLAVPRSAAAVLSATSKATHAVTLRSGLSNFYRGFTPTLWGMLPYAGTSFLTHDAAGDLMRRPQWVKYTVMPPSRTTTHTSASNHPPPLRAWAELTTGALAGFVSQTVSYPLEVIRRRMQVGGVVGDGHRLGMLEVARNIARGPRGWRGFFVGLGIGYVKVVPMAATSFYVYERGKVWLGI